MDAMHRFVSRENIARHQQLASESTDSTERSRIPKLLGDEVAKVKLELGRSCGAPEERSPVIAATKTWGGA